LEGICAIWKKFTAGYLRWKIDQMMTLREFQRQFARVMSIGVRKTVLVESERLAGYR